MLRTLVLTFALLPAGGLMGQQLPSYPPAASSTAESGFQNEVGPLERRANPVTPENPVPRRILYSPPEYPLQAAAFHARGSLTLRLTLDEVGRVEEARVVGITLKTDGYTVSVSGDDADAAFGRMLLNRDPGVAATARTVAQSLIGSAASAVRQWRYEPPFLAPIAFNVAIGFSPDVRAGLDAQPQASETAAGTVSRTPDGALRVGGAIGTPRKIKDVRPVYPPEAQAEKIQGVVIIEVRIDEEGKVSDAQVLRSLPMLDQAALDAVGQWEFTPTLLNGVPVPIVMTVTVNFTLRLARPLGRA